MKAKKYLALVIFASFLSYAKAQNTFPSSGNVGIGTTSPVLKFHIQGTNATALGARIENTDGDAYSLAPIPGLALHQWVYLLWTAKGIDVGEMNMLLLKESRGNDALTN